MEQTSVSQVRPGGAGFFRKPLIEQLKLLFVFACLSAIIWFSHPTLIYFYIGATVVVIGAIIRIWAGGHLTRDRHLTTSGPYQYTRNPFYLGRFLWIIGFAVMTGFANYVVYGVLILAIILFFAYYMPRKEKREGGRLEEYFGDDYRRWKSNVPSLFPRITPYVMNPKRWNAKLYFGNDGDVNGNREIWTTLSVIGIILLFFLRMHFPA